MLYMTDYIVTVVDRAEKFVETFNDAMASKLVRAIDLFKQFGGDLGLPHTKQIKKGLYELRLPGHPAIRLFYTVQNHQIIIFYGYIKKTMKLPLKELHTAQKLLIELGI